MSNRCRDISVAVLVAIAVWETACLPQKASSLNRASDLFGQGRYEEAAAEYRRVCELDPTWAAPQLGLGNALKAINRYADALAAYERAVTLEPNSPDPHIALAGLLLETQRWNDSERELEAAVRAVPNDGRLHAMLGYALFHQGRRREALRAFDRSRELCQTCMSKDEDAAYRALKDNPQ